MYSLLYKHIFHYTVEKPSVDVCLNTKPIHLMHWEVSYSFSLIFSILVRHTDIRQYVLLKLNNWWDIFSYRWETICWCLS